MQPMLQVAFPPGPPHGPCMQAHPSVPMGHWGPMQPSMASIPHPADNMTPARAQGSVHGSNMQGMFVPVGMPMHMPPEGLVGVAIMQAPPQGAPGQAPSLCWGGPGPSDWGPRTWSGHNHNELQPMMNQNAVGKGHEQDQMPWPLPTGRGLEAQEMGHWGSPDCSPSMMDGVPEGFQQSTDSQGFYPQQPGPSGVFRPCLQFGGPGGPPQWAPPPPPASYGAAFRAHYAPPEGLVHHGQIGWMPSPLGPPLGPWEDPSPRALMTSELSDLLFRDITPEDYDLLLQLDEGVERPMLSSSTAEKLPEASCSKDLQGESCSICITVFEKASSTAVLPCGHHFHRHCISRWLTEHRGVCPLCGKEVKASS